MTTVEELLSGKSISFRPSGRDYLVRCLNPEHEDRHPSMRIDKLTGIFNCLSCGYSGNLFNLFGETPNWLQLRRNKLKAAIENKLLDSVGLSIPKNAIPYEGTWRGISNETYSRMGAFESLDFQGRIVFPIRSVAGKIQAFTARTTTDQNPRYLNYPPKAKMPAFPSVKPIKGSIILVEGLFDMLNLHDKGLTNAVCNFGVRMPSNEQLNIFRMQGIDCINIFFDNDDAGKKATEELSTILDNKDFSSRKITFSNIKDPGELTKQQVIKLRSTLYENSYSRVKT